jgi:hypothetical protein
MKDTPIYFRREDNYSIQEVLTYPTNNKMKVELIQKTTLTDMYYVIKVNGEFHMSYNILEDAKNAYDRIKSATPREEVIESKEI